MVDQDDPRQVLGVGPEAGPEEVRRAFHQAVLDCHPDRCAGDVEEAKRRFSRIVLAYRRLRRILTGPGGPGEDFPAGDRFDPVDFTWVWFAEAAADPQRHEPPFKLEWWPQFARRKVTQPVVNETLVFLPCLALAVVMALAAGALVMIAIVHGALPDGAAGSTLFVLALLGTYAAVVALSLAIIVASRRTAWLLRLMGFRRQRSLPKTPHDRTLTDGRD